MRCESCQLVRINGLVCHETDCPERPDVTLRECKWCGCEFGPEFRTQRFCDQACHNAFHGFPEADEFGVDAEGGAS